MGSGAEAAGIVTKYAVLLARLEYSIHILEGRQGVTMKGRCTIPLLAACLFVLAAAQAPPIEWDSRDPQTFVDFGHGLVRIGEYRAALRAFERALELDPDLVEAILSKASLYRRIGEYDQALHEYERVLNHSNADEEEKASAEFGLGAFAFRDGAYREALQHFTRACTLNPESAQAYYYKGRCHESLDEFEEAADAYRHASDLEPDVVTYERALDRVLEILIW